MGRKKERRQGHLMDAETARRTRLLVIDRGLRPSLGLLGISETTMDGARFGGMLTLATIAKIKTRLDELDAETAAKLRQEGPANAG